nr:hypothetical protein [Desulfobulbaceae bacterium]
MLKRLFVLLFIIGLTSTSVFAACLNLQDDPQLCENREVLFQTGEGLLLQEKATKLGTPAKIYEYLRNNAEYSPYHGSRSNSLNSFLSLRGNDVDLTSALIALLRSQGIKARYAYGNIKISKVQLANWLGVIDTTLAASLLRDQGIQNVDDTDSTYVTFEHVWAEALVSYSNYRGGKSTQEASCATEGGSCRWVPLDASFKQKKYNETYRMLLRDLPFDYDAYYNAQNPGSPAYKPGLKNKNPLEVFDEEALEYLRVNHPGLTLEDVIDEGEIIADESGLLPASLPYEVVSPIIRYDSVADHDAGEVIAWTKYLRSRVLPKVCESVNILPHYDVPLAELSTKQLTVTLFAGQQGGVAFGHRLDSEAVGNTVIAGSVNISCAEGSYQLQAGTLVDLELEVDVEPGVPPEKVVYKNLVVGGYYLIASGGETSNETQLRRATEKLLQANDNYAIVVDSAGALGAIGDVYIDTNLNGVADTGDMRLLDDLEAQDALTGGLLYVAQSLYYTRLREDSERYGRLKGIISPISAYLGVVSTTQEVEYLNDVPFAITPGGLLIDLKGIHLNGTWEVDQPETYSSDAFLMIGHIASSLEHEVWQAITGYDAISTVRGIQFAMEQNRKLVNPKKNSQVDTFPASLTDLGFANTAPPDFTQSEYDLFGRRLVSWSYGGADPANAGFNVFLANAEGLLPGDTAAMLATYNANNGIDSFYSTYDATENNLIADQAFEGALKTGFITTSLASLYQTYDVLAANVTTPAGFSVVSFNRTASNMYQYVLNETSQHTDGVYPITIGLKLADATDVVPYTMSGATGYTVFVIQNTTPAGFVVNASVSGDILTISYSESSAHANGIYNLNTEVVLRKGTSLATVTAPISVEIIGNRFVDTPATLNTSMDVSDNQSFTCAGGPNGESVQYTGAPTALLVDLENCFNNLITINDLQGFTDFFDRNLSFDPSTHVYRSKTIGIDDYDIDFVMEIRDFMYGHITNTWGEYLLPDKMPRDTYYLFSVYLKNGYDEFDDLGQSTYAIVNHSNRLASGGGYVTATEAIDPAKDQDFNNEVFTDLNMISVSNNDLVVTPSTADPVSTVTGNMYHDETDLVIKGKGLDYAFTRTYNSNQAKNSSADFPISKGWTHSYNMRLTANDYGQYPNYDSVQAPENGNAVVSSITFMDERGGEANYLVDGEGASWAVTSPTGGFDTLALNTPVAGQHTITYRNGVKYLFEGVNGADLRTVGDTARLKQIADPYGNQLNFSYNGAGQLVTIADNLGIAGRTGLTLAYHGDGRLNTISDWAGRTWTYEYLNGNLSSVENPLLKKNQYTYHPDSSLLKDISKPELRAGAQVTTTFNYYENDRAFSYTNIQGESEILDYDLFRKKTRVTDPRGFIRTHLYDENGALVKLEEPDKGILLFENNADGLRYQKRDALGFETTYSYCSSRTLAGCASDTGGNVTSEQDAYLQTVDYDYGLFDQVTRVKDKNGNERFYTYYPASIAGTGAVKGKLQKVEATLAAQTVTLEEYSYYDNGNPKQKTEYVDQDDPSKKRLTDYFYEVNSLNPNRVTVTGLPSGETITTTYTYDSLGRIETETRQRVTSATDPTVLNLTTTYGYDALGRVVTVTDPLGNIKELIYDANGKVKEERVHYKKPDATYDIRTNVVKEYDSADRLVKETDIYNKETLYDYDAAGNLITVTDANGHTSRYQYDAMGRQTAVIDANGHRSELIYDLAGQVVRTQNANGQVTKH